MLFTWCWSQDGFSGFAGSMELVRLLRNFLGHRFDNKDARRNTVCTFTTSLYSKLTAGKLEPAVLVTNRTASGDQSSTGWFRTGTCNDVCGTSCKPGAQTICLPTGPRCDSCLLSENKLCPSAKKSGGLTSKKMRSPKVEIEIEDLDSCETGN